MYIDDYVLPGQFRCETCGNVKGISDYDRHNVESMMVVLIGSGEGPPICNLCALMNSWLEEEKYSGVFIPITISDGEKDDDGS